MASTRNVGILKKIDSSSGTNLIKIYQPGTLNLATKVAEAKYDGFIASLRLIVKINSIAEFVPPDISPLDSDFVANSKNKTALNNAEKIGLTILIGNADNETPIELNDVWLLSQPPYYYVDLLRLLTSANNATVSSDESIYLKLKDLGKGLLTATDMLIVRGNVIETSDYEVPSPAPTFNINCSGGTSTGTGGSGTGGSGTGGSGTGGSGTGTGTGGTTTTPPVAGDTSDLFYKLGTNNGTQAFENPQTSGKVTFTASGIDGGALIYLTDRQPGSFYTSSNPNAFVEFSLAQGAIKPTHYALKSRSEARYYLRSWKFQGLSGADWVDLDTQTNNTNHDTPDQWLLLPIPPQAQYFSHLRILQNGETSDGYYFICLGEMQVWGDYQI